MQSDITREPNRSMVEQLADTISAHADAKVVYGQPVTSDGITVIPVAKVRYGFGGGSGQQPGRGEGAGGGGGVQATPVGFIELRGGDAIYRRIDTASVWARLILASGFGLWLGLRGASLFLRSARRGRLRRWLGV